MALGRQDKAIVVTNSGSNVIRLAGFLVIPLVWKNQLDPVGAASVAAITPKAYDAALR